MASLVYDPDKLTPEQLKALEEIREAAECSQDEELGKRMSDYLLSGKFHEEQTKQIGKSL